MKCLVLADEKSIKYFLGEDAVTGVLLIAKEKVLITPEIRKVEGVRVIRSNRVFDELKKQLLSFGIRKVYVPFDSTDKVFLERLMNVVKVVDFSKELLEKRMVKTREEVKSIKEAVRITCEVIGKASEKIRQGIREKDLARFILSEGLKEADGIAFFPIVSAGVNTLKIHPLPTNNKIRKGEFIVVDCGFKVSGYCSDITRTFAIKPTEEQVELFNIVREAQEIAVKRIKKAKFFSEPAKAVKAFFKQEGVFEDWCYSLGHGIGLDVHEEPSITVKSKDKVVKGVTFALEPGLITKTGGLRIEDDYYFNRKVKKLSGEAFLEL